ncbi:HD-GYP domain-containing protein, partial [Escherichia coli]|uniref:HD-GYP domain-containing protein n=1 Tax=Escherichia coli TaxID=562 RepID=UPI0011217437
QSLARNPSAFVSLARLKTRDDYTYMHSVAVCALMIGLSRQLGHTEEQVREAGLAGLLHDIGKMQMPLDVLNKPGSLTDEEFKVMRTHPEHGYELLKEGVRVPEVALDVALHHHEKLDGSGYPHGLAGE